MVAVNVTNPPYKDGVPEVATLNVGATCQADVAREKDVDG
jgi:hypothetical protein